MSEQGLPSDRNVWQVKRKLHIPGLVEPADAKALEEALADIDGVVRVSADHGKQRVAVEYLCTKTDYQSLERAAEAAGFPPAVGAWALFRSGWCQNLDLNGRDKCQFPPVPVLQSAPRKESAGREDP
jgi:hypothetical protein